MGPSGQSILKQVVAAAAVKGNLFSVETDLGLALSLAVEEFHQVRQ